MCQRHTSIVRLLAILVSVCLLVAGCVTESPTRLEPRGFSTVAIVSPYEFIDYISPETKGQKATDGAVTGMGAGLGAAAVGSLFCGPFLYALCLATLTLGGMAVGGVGGLLYGVTGISAKDVETLDRKLHELGASGDLQTMLTESLRRKVPEQMLAPVEEAEVQALVSIGKIEMRHRDDELYLKVTARFEYARKSPEEPEDGQVGHREVEGRSARHPLDYWLSADEAVMQAAMAECQEKIATEMGRLLYEHWDGA